jgi:hypothetical protein
MTRPFSPTATKAEAKWRLLARRLHEELKRRPELRLGGVTCFEIKDVEGKVVHQIGLYPDPRERAR